MLRTTPNRTTDDWITHHQFHIWPLKRHRAILWTLANVIKFRLQQQTNLTLQDYMAFLQKSRWKLMSKKKGENLSVTTSRSWKLRGGGITYNDDGRLC